MLQQGLVPGMPSVMATPLVSPFVPPNLFTAPGAPREAFEVAVSTRGGAAPPPPEPTIAPGTNLGELAAKCKVIGFEEFMVMLEAGPETPHELLCDVAEVDLIGALENVQVEGRGLPPLKRAALVRFLRTIFLSAGYPALGLGAGMPAPPPKAMAPPPPVHHSTSHPHRRTRK